MPASSPELQISSTEIESKEVSTVKSPNTETTTKQALKHFFKNHVLPNEDGGCTLGWLSLSQEKKSEEKSEEQQLPEMEFVSTFTGPDCMTRQHRIYSMTKPIVALAFARMLEKYKGKLSLDDELSKFLPEFEHVTLGRKQPEGGSKMIQELCSCVARGRTSGSVSLILHEGSDEFKLFTHLAEEFDLEWKSENLEEMKKRVRVFRKENEEAASTEEQSDEKKTYQITLRQLLSHTSGIGYGPGGENVDDGSGRPLQNRSGYMYEELAKKVDRREITSLKEWCIELSKIPLVSEPGTKWMYSYSIDVLGRVLEVVEGRPLDEILKEYVFEPCGMENTSFVCEKVGPLYSAPAKGRGLRQLSSTGYDYSAEGRSEILSGGGGVGYLNGGLVSTAEDYLKFCFCLMENKRICSTNKREDDKLSDNPGFFSRFKSFFGSTPPGSPTGQQKSTALFQDPAFHRSILEDNQLPLATDGKIFFHRKHLPSGTYSGWNFFGSISTSKGDANSIHDFSWGGFGGTLFYVSPKHKAAYVLMRDCMNAEKKVLRGSLAVGLDLVCGLVGLDEAVKRVKAGAVQNQSAKGGKGRKGRGKQKIPDNTSSSSRFDRMNGEETGKKRNGRAKKGNGKH